MKRHSIFLVVFLLAFATFFWFGIYNNWHYIFWWFDDALHFLGGFWLASLFLYLLKRLRIPVIGDSFWLKLILGLGFVALVGVLWEFHEFIADWLAQTEIMQSGLQDTMGDLFMDLMGGFILFVIDSICLPFLLKKY